VKSELLTTLLHSVGKNHIIFEMCVNRWFALCIFKWSTMSSWPSV